MSETRFTPGPWAFGDLNLDCIEVFKVQRPAAPKTICTIIVDGTDGTGTVDRTYDGPNDQEADANACLIHASTDLYEALEKSARALRHYEHIFNQLYADARRSYPAGVDAEKAAMAALAKARGEVTP